MNTGKPRRGRVLPTAAARKAFALPGTQEPGEGPEKTTAAGVRDAAKTQTRCASCPPQPRVLPTAGVVYCGFLRFRGWERENWEGQVTGFDQQKKKEGRAAFRPCSDMAKRSAAARRPTGRKRHTGGQNPAAAPFAHRTEGRRVNIGHFAGRPPSGAREPPRPAHRTQPRRDTSPRSRRAPAAARRPRRAAGALPQILRLRDEKAVLPGGRAAPPAGAARPARPLPMTWPRYGVRRPHGPPSCCRDLRPSRRISRNVRRAGRTAGRCLEHARGNDAPSHRQNRRARRTGHGHGNDARRADAGRRPEHGHGSHACRTGRDAGCCSGHARRSDASRTGARWGREGTDRSRRMTSGSCWRICTRSRPDDPAPLLRVDSTEQIEEPEPPQPEPEDNAEGRGPRCCGGGNRRARIGANCWSARAGRPAAARRGARSSAPPMRSRCRNRRPKLSRRRVRRQADSPRRACRLKPTRRRVRRQADSPRRACKTEAIPAQGAQAKQPARAERAEHNRPGAECAGKQPAARKACRPKSTPAQGAQASSQPRAERAG